MAVRTIRVVPDEVLRKKAKKVSNIDTSVQRLVNDMIDTLHDASGVGLAAPQVGVSLRVVVIEVTDGETLVLINPEVIKREGERTVDEGCLSVPGYRGEVKRAQKVKVKALDRTGKLIRITGDELLGQALEHEIDHLNGVLYTDYIDDPSKLYQITEEAITEQYLS